MAEPLMMLDWRAYPAAALLLLGAELVAAGLSEADHHRRRQRSLDDAFAYLHAFRGVVVGLAIVGIGVGWGWQIPRLVAAGLCVGVGELLESTYYIEVLRWGQRRGVLTPTTASPAIGMRPTPGGGGGAGATVSRRPSRRPGHRRWPDRPTTLTGLRRRRAAGGQPRAPAARPSAGWRARS